MSPPSPQTRLRRVGRTLRFLALPLLLGLCGLMAGRSVRPLWMGASGDPSYPYLLNSLMLAEGLSPAFASHPGTPLIVLGAAAVRATHLAVGTSPLRDHVLTSPDVYVEAIRVTLIVAIVLANAFQGWAAFRLTRSAAVTVLAQLTPLLSPTVMLAHLHVQAETLVLPLVLVLSGLVMLRLGREETCPERRWALLAGAIVGLGTATKLTFAGLALVPLALLRGRARRLCAAAVAASFAAGLLPIAGRLGAAVDWVGRLVLRTGDLGQGSSGIVDPSRYQAAFFALLGREYLGAGLFVAGAAVFLWQRVARRGPDALRRGLGAVLVGVLVTWLGAAKGSAGYHYLVPALGLSGCLAAATAAVAQRDSERGRRLARVLALAASVLLPIHATVVAWRYFEQRRPVMPGAAAARRAIQRHGGESRALLGYEPSTIPAAMSLGNDWTGHEYSEDLRRLYPDVVSFDWAGFHVFGRPAVAEELASRLHGDALLLWGTSWESIDKYVWASSVRLEPLDSFGRDRLLLARVAPVPRAGSPPPFAGALFLRGLPDLAARFATAERDRPALGPTMRVVFVGDGAPLTLDAKFRNERPDPQPVVLRLNGEELVAQHVPVSGEWMRWERPLRPRTGLNELTLSFGATYGPLGEAFTHRAPGFARDHIEGEVTGIRFRRFRVLREP